MEPFQNNGIWWVPGTPERVSGKIEFAPTEGVTLELNGTLPYEGDGSERNARFELEKEQSVIYGDLGQGGMMTIQHAVQTSANFGGNVESEEYTANQVFVGDRLPENPTFQRMDFYIDEIPTWTNASTVRSVVDREAVEDIVDYDEVEAAFATTGSTRYSADVDSFEINVSNYSKTSSSARSVEMETVGILEVIADDEASLDTLSEYGVHALEYLSFAIGTGIYPDEIQVHTETNDRPVDYYYTILDYTANRSANRAHHLFSPNNVGFENTLRNWIEHRDQSTEVHQNYASLIHRSNLTPQLRLLTATIALEAFYDAEHPSETVMPEEQFDEIQSDIMDVVPDNSDIQSQIYGLLENVANSPSIKDKLIELMESEEELIGIFFDIPELASEARRQRNALAHGSMEATQIELNVLSEKLRLVLEALLARKIGVPADDLPNPLASRHQGLVGQLDISEDSELL